MRSFRNVRRLVPMTPDFRGDALWLRIDGKLWVTPLFVALAFIEFSDVIFAVDSVPAIFALTNEPFIVFTSNVFAILGLRAMYFLLKDFADRFHLLKYGLAFVLMFVGTKMLIVEFFKIPVLVSLGTVAIPSPTILMAAGAAYTMAATIAVNRVGPKRNRQGSAKAKRSSVRLRGVRFRACSRTRCGTSTRRVDRCMPQDAPMPGCMALVKAIGAPASRTSRSIASRSSWSAKIR